MSGSPSSRLAGRGRALGQDRARLAILGAVVVWVAIMYLHVWRRHDRFGTFDQDLGFHDHYVWLLARGHAFSSVLGLHAFGHNATYGYLLLAPLSWVGLGPQGLDLINTIAVGLAALALFDLARDRVEDDRLALALGGAFLLHPLAQGNAWETFHPEALAIAPMIVAYRHLGHQRWARSACWLGFALLWKSDVGLVVAVLGILVALRGDRRPGAALLGAGLLWTAITTMVVIPAFSGGGTVFGPLFGDIGDSPAEVAKTAVTDPGRVASTVADHRPVRYVRDLLAPSGFVVLAAPGALALAAPQMVINLLSDADFTREWRDNPHYQALPLTALAIGSVEAVARLRRRRPAWAGRAAGVVLGSSLAATVAWGSLWPLSTQAAHYWSADGDPARAAKEAAVDLPDADDSVSAHYLLVSHLTHRRLPYTWPNPWQQVYYYDDPPDPAEVEWLLMDLSLLAPDGPDRELWDCVVGSGAFQNVLDRDGIVAYRRIDGRTDDRACQR